jgi:hypothetical protein
MPRRITKAFFAAAAAGATITTLGFAAASPAGAMVAGKHSHPKYFSPTGGTPIPTNAQCVIPTSPALPIPSTNCGMAGYQASGRDFRFSGAQIKVPNHVGATETSPADPSLYVALDNSTTNTYEYARVGVAPCTTGAIDSDDFIVPGVAFPTGFTTCPASGWVAFDAVVQPTTTPSISVAPLSTALLGDVITASVYLSSNDNQIETQLTLPTGVVIAHVIPVSGPTYTKAQALADWTTVAESGAPLPEPAVPSVKVRDTQFFQGRFTTLSGARGTFSGPWTTTALEATSNGSLPPPTGGGTLIGQPSYLWNDGSSLGGAGSDAFGVWRFPF